MNKQDILEDTVVYMNDPSNINQVVLELEHHQISTWDNPFKVFLNYELVGSYKTFSGLKKRAEKIIDQYNLKPVDQESFVQEESSYPRANNKGPFAPF